MNVIISINGTKFLSPDAVTAAKVADLLGKMRPVGSKYWHTDFDSKDYKSGNAFFFEGGKNHQVSIDQIDRDAVLENELDADEFIKIVTDCPPEMPKGD